MKSAWNDFSDNTTTHGIPHVKRATKVWGKVYWLILFVFCLLMFIYEASSILEKFSRNEKIVNMELNAYRAAMEQAKHKDNPTARILSRKKRTAENRSEEFDYDDTSHLKSIVFEPTYSACDCTGVDENDINGCKEKKKEKPVSEEALCICAFDRDSHDTFPCYQERHFTKEDCPSCNKHGICFLKDKKFKGKTGRSMCYCNVAVGFCVQYDGGTLLKLWEYFDGIRLDAEFNEAMGFANMTDEVAIVTRARENILFAMSGLSNDQREMLSITRPEFVHKCSFNSKSCDLKKDFIKLMDPTFGACFTYNWNMTNNVSTSRAGPMYGLRILVFVNGSEYLPTTEASGVRLTVHEKTDYPFPDTFGYSAPTGYISSFGLRLKRVYRLPAPFGTCVERENLKSEYIYEGFDYSVEGCYRTCFQQLVTKDCGCCDPRFPSLTGYKHCSVADPRARKCLEKRTRQLGGMHGTFSCNCQHPCTQSSFAVTYSASRWPLKTLKVEIGELCTNETMEDCIKNYQESGAMLEVFYEQMNFEMLKENEAYGWVKVLADFGGQLGLWLGVSVLTCFEIFMLVWRAVYLTVNHQRALYFVRKQSKPL